MWLKTNLIPQTKQAKWKQSQNGEEPEFTASESDEIEYEAGEIEEPEPESEPAPILLQEEEELSR